MIVYVVLDSNGIWSICENEQIAEKEEILAKKTGSKDVRIEDFRVLD